MASEVRFGLSRKNRMASDDDLRCSFCQKRQNLVGKLISSPSDYPRAYICGECIAVCNSILEDDAGTPAAAADAGANALLTELHGLVDLIPESDQETVWKILNALALPQHYVRDRVTTTKTDGEGTD
jgi:ATP-dependent Clp protease ATP-binding subunit ClpX